MFASRHLRQHPTILSFTLFVSIFLNLLTNLPAGASDKDCTFRAGWEQWPPYAIRQGRGDATGLDILLMSIVAQDMGCTIKFTEKPWQRIMFDIREGNIDMVAGAAITDERKEFGIFSHIWRDYSIGLFMRKGETSQLPIARFSEVLNFQKRIGFVKGYEYGDDWDLVKTDERFRAIRDISLSTEVGFRKLANRRIDAMIDDPISGIATAKNLDVDHLIEIHPVKVSSAPVYILFSKKVPRSRIDLFNEALSRIKVNGDYDKIFAAYLIPQS